MDFTGTIIDESLKDKTILADLKILKTGVEPVTEKDNTPWLKQWTIHMVEIPEEQAQAMAEKVSRALEGEHSCWYADFKNDKLHYIVFKDRVFTIERANGDYAGVKAYGLAQGIPEHELDFSPSIS